MENGDFMIFALKLSNAYPKTIVRQTLKKLLFAINLNGFQRHPLNSINFGSFQGFFQDIDKLIQFCSFPGYIGDPFNFLYNALTPFMSKRHVLLSTELFYYIKAISPTIVGSALFHNNDLILSEISLPLLSLFPIFISPNYNLRVFNVANFRCFQIFLEKDEEGDLTSEYENAALCIYNHKSVQLLVMIKVPSSLANVDEKVLNEIKNLLKNGINDFATETDNMRLSNKLEGIPTLLYYNLTNNILSTALKQQSVADKFLELHCHLLNDKQLKEISVFNGKTIISAVSLPNLEVIVEAQTTEPNQIDVTYSYTRILQFLPTLTKN
jgi:hypothetical protein